MCKWTLQDAGDFQNTPDTPAIHFLLGAAGSQSAPYGVLAIMTLLIINMSSESQCCRLSRAHKRVATHFVAITNECGGAGPNLCYLGTYNHASAMMAHWIVATC